MLNALQLAVRRFAGLVWVAFGLWSGCTDATSPVADVAYPADAAPSATRGDDRQNAFDGGDTVDDASTSTVHPNPLVGIWQMRPGYPPPVVEATLNLSSDNTMKFIAVVEPSATPAGAVPTTCVVSDEFDGTYATAIANGSKRFASMFTTGLVNRITGCEDGSMDRPGTPASADDVPGLVGRGILPPPSVAYTVTSTTLTLFSPEDRYGGIGQNPGTKFTRAP